MDFGSTAGRRLGFAGGCRGNLGCATRLFHYASVSADVTANVSCPRRIFWRRCRRKRCTWSVTAWAALILDFFEHARGKRPAACAGTDRAARALPCAAAARRSVSRVWPFGRTIMGATAAHLLLAPPPALERRARFGDHRGRHAFRPRPAGRDHRCAQRRYGIGRGDALEGAKEHLTLPVTHSGMVFSAAVARQTAAFLRDGHFGAL